MSVCYLRGIDVSQQMRRRTVFTCAGAPSAKATGIAVKIMQPLLPPAATWRCAGEEAIVGAGLPRNGNAAFERAIQLFCDNLKMAINCTRDWCVASNPTRNIVNRASLLVRIDDDGVSWMVLELETGRQ